MNKKSKVAVAGVAAVALVGGTLAYWSSTVTIDYDNTKRLDQEITDTNQTIYQKVETMLKSDEKGYADADYVLTIVTELCQSTEDEEGNAIPTKWPMPTTASN